MSVGTGIADDGKLRSDTVARHRQDTLGLGGGPLDRPLVSITA